MPQITQHSVRTLVLSAFLATVTVALVLAGSAAAKQTGAESGARAHRASATFSSEVLADSPAGYWRLNDSRVLTAKDELGQNTGTYVGGFRQSQVGALVGDFNKAVALDGVNGTIRFADSAALDQRSALSIELWVQPSAMPAASATLARKDGQYLLRLNWNGQLIFRLWKAGAASELRTAVGDVTAGAWTHIVATWDGQTMTVYANGTARGSLAFSGSLDTSTNPLFVGSSTGTYDWVAANIDELALYGKALSAARVQAHYVAGTGGVAPTPDSTPPTVALSQPANGSTVSGQVSVAANAADNVGVARVDFSVDGVQKASDTSSPYGFGLDSSTLSNGSHTITAKSYDAAGNASPPSSASVTVSNSTPAPNPGPACTLYASPSGSSSNSGTSTSSPLTLSSAAGKTVAGSVVCLMAGTYNLSSSWYISRAGAPGKYIVYRNYGGTATIKWTGGASTMIGIMSGASYVELNGLTIDASNAANQDVACNTAHHVRVIGNTLMNGGAAGFSSYHCDYMTLDHNLIYHAGYVAGWSSAISFNMDVWVDQYAGFHNFATNNIISGTYDNSSVDGDGNGIIVDSGGNVPPTLIANNVVYENYYRCTEAKEVTHVWVVNNTCYKNALRPRPSSGYAGEITSYASTDVHFINNIVYAWGTTRPYKVDSTSTVTYEHNSAYGGATSEVPSSVLADATKIRIANPMFLDPPAVDPTANGQWASALPPWQLGNRLTLQSSSPLLNQGIDPSNAIGLTPELRAGMEAVLGTDIAGQSRPASGPSDLGAYES